MKTDSATRRMVMPDTAPVNDGSTNVSGSETQNTTESPQTTPTQTTPNQTQTQSGPLKLSDDMEVIWEGSEKPVKFSNLRGLQSQFTKVSQARAELDKQIKAERDEKQRLQNALRVALGQSVQAPQQDPFGELKERPYITGQQAAQLATQLQQSQAPMVQVLQAMAQKVLNLENQLSSVNKDYFGRSHEAKIKGFLGKLGLDPEEYFDEADIFYRAHEGDDLDSEFPELFKKFISTREEREKRLRQKRLEAAKNRPFVPGKGGLASTGGDLGLKGNESPAELADKVWTMLQGNET